MGRSYLLQQMVIDSLVKLLNIEAASTAMRESLHWQGHSL